MKHLFLKTLFILSLLAACTLNPPSIRKAPMEPMPWDMTAAAQRNPEAWVSVEEIQYTPMPMGGGGGTILLSTGCEYGQSGSIYFVNVDGTGKKEFVDGLDGNFGEASWSSDGTRIAYAKNGKIQIHGFDNEIIEAPETSGDQFNPVWSPDGSKLAFYTTWVQSYPLVIWDLTTMTVREFRSTGYSEIAWSPDGELLVYVLNDELYRVIPDGGVNLLYKVANAEGGRPLKGVAWSPDGSRLAIGVYTEDLYYSRIVIKFLEGGERDLWRASSGIPGMTAENLKWGFGWKTGRPDWSPDGTQIIFDGTFEGTTEIFVIGEDGEDLTQLTNMPDSHELSPLWSPDGTMIAFISENDETSDLYVMNADGSNLRQLTDMPEYVCDPAWQP